MILFILRVKELSLGLESTWEEGLGVRIVLDIYVIKSVRACGSLLVSVLFTDVTDKRGGVVLEL